MTLTETSAPTSVTPPTPDRQGRGDRDTTKSLPAVPTAQEIKLVGDLRQLFNRARAERRPMVQKWKRWYKVLRNNYWVTGRPSWMPNPEIPEVWPIIASMVGWATDQRIKGEVFPASVPYAPYNDFLTQLGLDLETVMDSSWHINGEESQAEIVLWDAFTYGTGFFKTDWDKTLHQGQGDAIMRRVDPFTIYPDPDATSLLDADYIIEARTMSLQEIDRRWPGTANTFREGGYIEDIDESPNQLDNSGTFPRANPGAISPSTSPRYGLPGMSSVHINDDRGITVLECWLREHEHYQTTRVDEMGKSYTDKRTYDSWRVVVVAGGRVLMNEPADELWEHGKHPYDRYVPQDTGEFWGESLVGLLSSAQTSYNRVLAGLQHNVELVGNPVFLESNRSGIQRSKITNRPGERVTVNQDVDQAKWLNPPQVHQAMPELIRHYLQRMEAVSGLSAVTKGSTPSGRNAQGVVDSMQEAAFVRVRMLLRNLEYALRGALEKKASLISEFYTTPRIVAIVGDTGERTSLALRGRHFYTPSELGANPLRFALLVNAGSGSHTSRKVREDQAVMLFTLGALDVDGLLEAVDFPNRKRIAQRVEQQKAAGMMEPPGARQRAQRTS